MVAILRLDAGAHPDDPRTTELVGELTLKSPEFPRWWAQHKVLDRTWGHKRFHHTLVGPLEIDYEALHLPGDPDQTLFVYRASEGDIRSAEALTLLASWSTREADSTADDPQPEPTASVRSDRDGEPFDDHPASRPLDS